MEEEEIKLLKKIEELHSKLRQEPYGQWTGSFTLPPSGYGYSNNAKQLYEKACELKSEFNPEYLTDSDIAAFAHTLGKEVSHVEYHYDEAMKGKAAKKRHDEFIGSINKANSQIELDLFSLFKQISDNRTE